MSDLNLGQAVSVAAAAGDMGDFNNKTWILNGEGSEWCAAHPDYDLCKGVKTNYEYAVDLAPNAILLAIFAMSFIGFAAVWAIKRRATAFNIALLLGLVCEILGYAGRIISWDNPWDENGFLIQICCLTIGPAFMAAGVYLCLRRIVSAFGPENSRIPPAYYTRIFIPCDVVSLVLQAAGGAMASISSSNNESSDTGSNIMIAGLSFQVITLVVFIAAALDFAYRTWSRQRAMGSSALDQNPVLVQMRSTFLFKGFLGALSLATICILWRSAFRVAELSEGWTGPIMADQYMFFGFEGVLIAVAVLVLNVFHPALCIGPLFETTDGGLGGCCGSRRKAAARGKSFSDVESKPASSDGSGRGQFYSPVNHNESTAYGH